jgi:hypothetical protein
MQLRRIARAVAVSLGLCGTARGAAPEPAEPPTAATPEASPAEPAPTEGSGQPEAPADAPEDASEATDAVEGVDDSEAPEVPRRPATQRRHRFEVEVGSEPTWPSASRMGRILSARNAGTGSLRLGWRVDDRLTLTAGLRGGGDLRDEPGAWRIESRFEGVLAGARLAEPLGRWFEVAAELEGEVLGVETTLERDGVEGTGGGVTLGLTPRVGLGATIPLGRPLGLRMRLSAGYAFRTATALDDVVLVVPGAAASAPRDLGSVDLSGFQLAFNLGLAF